MPASASNATQRNTTLHRKTLVSIYSRLSLLERLRVHSGKVKCGYTLLLHQQEAGQ
jgi:hypothetical protein